MTSPVASVREPRPSRLPSAHRPSYLQHSRGTPGVLKWYSRGTQGLKGYSRGARPPTVRHTCRGAPGKDASTLPDPVSAAMPAEGRRCAVQGASGDRCGRGMGRLWVISAVKVKRGGREAPRAIREREHAATMPLVIACESEADDAQTHKLLASARERDARASERAVVRLRARERVSVPKRASVRACLRSRAQQGAARALSHSPS
jgi:hypothetical protein